MASAPGCWLIFCHDCSPHLETDKVAGAGAMRPGDLLLLAFGAAFALFVAGPNAAAQDGADDLPALHIITCNDRCTNFTPARPILHAAIPPPLTLEHTLAGLVVLQYVVGVDGKVRSVDVLQRQGPSRFAESVVATVRAWTFEPAKLNGKPIETIRTFSATLRGPEADFARQFVIDAYDRGKELLVEGKEDEALSALNGAGEMLELNFYERSMMAYPLALVAFKKQDYLETHRLVGLAKELGSGRLPTATDVGLWELRIESDLMLGDMADANWSYQQLAHRPGFQIDSPAVKLLKKANTTVDTLPVLPVMAKIPSAEEGDVYSIGLIRNTFSFQTISGSIEKFMLVCNPQMLESRITDTAQWRVPKSWGPCGLIVHGAPGSTFRILQSNS
jgi:TonB family protein